MVKQRLCVVTATRAEYGLWRPVLARLASDPEVELLLAVTGAHLSSTHGATRTEIETDGYIIDTAIDIEADLDTPTGICRSMGLALENFGAYFTRTRPDLVLLLGDRFETFAVAAAATVCNRPIAHLYGGETTEGAFDEAFRHGITKMAHLHFTSTEAYRLRVIQMGEHPNRVHSVGALGVENALSLPLLSREELIESLGVRSNRPFALVTVHPVTLEAGASVAQFDALAAALERFDTLDFVFTRANADPDGHAINRRIDAFVARHPGRASVFASLGVLRYLSAMRHCAFVLGNSSSAIVEAPALKTIAIDVGDRQKGRIRAASTWHCDPTEDAIATSIARVLSGAGDACLHDLKNPYGAGETSLRIVELCKSALSGGIDLKKSFYDLESRT